MLIGSANDSNDTDNDSKVVNISYEAELADAILKLAKKIMNVPTETELTGEELKLGKKKAWTLVNEVKDGLVKEEMRRYRQFLNGDYYRKEKKRKD